MNYKFHKILTLEPLKSQFLIDDEWIEKTEEFRDILDYEGLYQISSFGRIKSLERERMGNGKQSGIIKERIRKPAKDTDGYLLTTLYYNGIKKTKRISQLVAITFLDHIPNGSKLVVDHKDFNILNNHLYNLQIVTQRENSSKDQWRHNRSSKYVGVHWNKSSKKWLANIRIDKRRKSLGSFDSELDAAEVYQTALKGLLQ